MRDSYLGAVSLIVLVKKQKTKGKIVLLVSKVALVSGVLCSLRWCW